METSHIYYIHILIVHKNAEVFACSVCVCVCVCVCKLEKINFPQKHLLLYLLKCYIHDSF
jgi:hypothetical protein